MDIAFNTDNNYVPFLCTTMLSLLEHNNKHVITFHILSLDLNKENKQYIINLASKQNCKIIFYNIDAKLLKNFPIGKGTSNPKYPSTGYLRLFIPEVTPNNIDKILYLDCDTIVTDDIEQLWNIDISNYCIAATDDYGENGKNGIKRLIGIDGYTYFNAGVLLMNLKNLREYNINQKSKEWIINNHNKVLFHDQDVLNALLYNKRMTLNSCWNHMTNYGNGVIIHFAGTKPWQQECKHPKKELFYLYLRKTKWKDMKPQQSSNYKNKFKKVLRYALKKMCCSSMD